jgi:hypothetical protein
MMIRFTSFLLFLFGTLATAGSVADSSPERVTIPGATAEAASQPTAPSPQRTALRYDFDYPVIGYAERPKHNSIARLQERLDAGEVKLQFHPVRGYLDSILRALDIDVSSQTLVFSKTSLQISGIRPATPRAIYFNDDTYVAWVQGSDMLELTTMDSALGPVFYTLRNRQDQPAQFARETSRCLACHDTYSMMGGGVPRFLVMSAFVDANGAGVTQDTSTEITDQTPVRDRWGGWYVTGQHGEQPHLGNIVFRQASDLQNLDSLRKGNLDSLEDLFDTRPYLSDKSDVVALLVLEHQLNIHNLITRTNFKSRTLLARNAQGSGPQQWAQLTPKMQRMLQPMMESLVRAMLFVDAAPLESRITGGSGFDTWFEARGPRDARGRSLRELDLTKRVFAYPLSYLVYSDGFNGLPDCARDYVYSRLRAVFTGQEASADFAHLSADDRKALLEILTATKAEFARATRS